MKVAVLFTGALRTIKKTIKYFKENVLLNENIHVFACVQNDTNISDTECDDWIRDEIGNNLKSIEWFNIISHQHWVQHRDYLLSNMVIDDNIKYYLKNSGSMIEYYQLQLAYIKMMNYEFSQNIKYDYIIRLRTDTIFAKPVDFHWLNWNDNEVNDRVEKIKNTLIENNIELSQTNIITYFMQTLLSDDIINNISNITGQFYKNRDILIDFENLNNYIKKGSYILTFRKNLLYIVKREYFYLIPSIGTFYGFINSDITESNYRWNAENQFQSACFNSNLSIYDYTTLFDENSLYKYNENTYFDKDYKIINPYMVYCIIRY